MGDELEQQKRSYEATIKEFEANKGMAQMVAGRPVALMPEEHRMRLFRGFCTEANVKAFVICNQKLEALKTFDLEDSELHKIDEASRACAALIEILSSNIGSGDLNSYRDAIAKLFPPELPSEDEAVTSAVKHLAETVRFLAKEPIEKKDSWDQMIDCVQMHDALSRLASILEAQEEPHSALPEVKSQVEVLESYFAEKAQLEDVKASFSSLSEFSA